MNRRRSGETQNRVQQVVLSCLLRSAVSATIVLMPFVQVFGRADEKPASAELAAREKEGCTQNLKAIYAAIEVYRRDHKDVPNWFSDLVPDYLPDVNVLVCPVCRRTGETESAALTDPRIASS